MISRALERSRRPSMKRSWRALRLRLQLALAARGAQQRASLLPQRNHWVVSKWAPGKYSPFLFLRAPRRADFFEARQQGSRKAAYTVVHFAKAAEEDTLVHEDAAYLYRRRALSVRHFCPGGSRADLDHALGPPPRDGRLVGNSGSSSDGRNRALWRVSLAAAAKRDGYFIGSHGLNGHPSEHPRRDADGSYAERGGLLQRRRRSGARPLVHLGAGPAGGYDIRDFRRSRARRRLLSSLARRRGRSGRV